MKTITAIAIDRFKGDTRSLLYATEGGTTPMLTKDAGVVDVPYSAGDILLADATETVIAGPISLTGLVELAELVLDGNQRACTDPKTLLVLAAGVAGFAIQSRP